MIQALNSIFRYLDGLLIIDIRHFKGMMGRIYSRELQLNIANASVTSFYLYLAISNGFVSAKFIISALTSFFYLYLAISNGFVSAKFIISALTWILTMYFSFFFFFFLCFFFFFFF